MALQLFMLEEANGDRRKAPVFRERRNDLDRLTRTEFRDRTRLTLDAYMELHGLIEEDITPIMPCNHAITSHTKLQATLRFFAQGSMLQSNADLYGISKASMGGHLNKVIDAISSRVGHFVFMPENLVATKREFFEEAGMPNVIGSIDGTHVNVTALKSDIEHAYVNRKGNHSINVQAVCNRDRLFTNVVARWPGSSHDSHVFNNSELKAEILEGAYGNGWLLGDSGYACTPYLMTPFVERDLTAGQQAYNRAHKKTRVMIERAFGELKARFRCLNDQGGALHYEPSKACRIITSCVCLHNLCKRHGIALDQEAIIDLEEMRLQDGMQAQAQDQDEGRTVRQRLVDNAFG